MKKYILLASRVGSYVIDYILFLILVYIVGKNGVAWFLLCLIIFFIYRYLFTAIYGGTLGMLLLKLTLDKFDYRICLRREIIRFASAFYFIGYFYGVFDSMGRTFHDIGANTYVKYKGSKTKEIMEPFVLRLIIYLILIVSVTKWSTSFILNDIGGIGLNKICTSDEYFQSFDGDNLISLSQQDLYLNTLGRKYTAIVDFGNKPFIVRISNKLKYTEIYKLKSNGSKILGEYAYRINIPIQYICSGVFRNKLELCGITPQKQIVLIDEHGDLFGNSKINIQGLLSVKCGDIDNDGKEEIVALSKNGDGEIFKYEKGVLKEIFNKKIGEDIIPEAFYLDNGMVIAAKADKKSVLYAYKYNGKNFILLNEKYINLKEIYNISKVNSNLLISNINRSNMMLRLGNIQRFEMYSINNNIHRLYNFGARPARKYDYQVRNLEGFYDINGDGKKELVVKAVGKDDVMGQGYVIEAYKFSPFWLKVNRVLTWIEGAFLRI